MLREWPRKFILDAQVANLRIFFGDPPPTLHGCSNCGDRGYMYAFYVDSGPFRYVPNNNSVISTYQEGLGWFTGHTEAALCPVCGAGRELEYLAGLSGLSGKDLDIRLDQFQEIEGKIAARQIAVDLLSTLPNPTGFATFYGANGVGKTMLLKAIVNGARLAGIPATYTIAADMISDIRGGFDDRIPRSTEGLLADYQNLRVLAIDEIDRINTTPWVKETLFRLLGYRYDRQDIYMTLLATNTAPDRMPEDLRYLSSRILGATHVAVGGVDMRTYGNMGYQQGDLHV